MKPHQLLLMTLLQMGWLQVRGEEPSKPPSANFDLTHWKLTLPVNEAGELSGKASEIQAVELSEYTHPDFFYSDENGGMVFRAPVVGATTEGSDYCRTELRELVDPQNDNLCWPAPGTHALSARCRVNEVPSSQKVIIGQIHSSTGKAKPLIKLQFFKGRIEALIKESPTKGKDHKLTFPDVGLGNDFDYEIKLEDGLLSITVNDLIQSFDVYEKDPEWAAQEFYFKAGAYVQDQEGPATEGGSVTFLKLKASHS